MPARKQASVQGLVQGFARWTPGAVDDEELGILDLLLTVRGDLLTQEHTLWRAGDIEQLLLDVFPHKVQSDPFLLQSGPRVLGSFLRYLEQTGQLHGSGLYQQLAELADVTPMFASAMDQSGMFGLAKSMAAAMQAEGVDLTDGQAVQRWMMQLADRPYAERVALVGSAADALAPEAELVLPPVVLAPDDELCRAAAAAPLVQRVDALLAHVGPAGRPVTQTGALRLLDAKALAEVCGDDQRLNAPAHWQTPVRRMADLPGVEEAFALAEMAELLVLSASRVRRDPAHPGATDAAAKAAALADAALALGVFVGDPPPRLEPLVETVGAELPGVLTALYAADEPLETDALAEHLVQELDLDSERWGSTTRSYLERALARFERLGMLTRLGVHVTEEHARGGLDFGRATSVALTPLGVWWLQQTLPEFGVRTPVVGEAAQGSAAELADALGAYSVEDAQAELAAWMAARGPDQAAEQLADLLRSTEVQHRQFSLHFLDDVPGAEPAVRRLLDDPAGRAYARVWLQSNGCVVDDRYLHPEDELRLFVDTAGFLIDLDGADALVSQLSGFGAQDRQVQLVRQLWRVESPFTESVLQALADAAPAAVSKAARKALHSLRSARR